eukprot:COSAG03_NODE_946_length_5235_cov_80.053933_10_plen_104_part_00
MHPSEGRYREAGLGSDSDSGAPRSSSFLSSSLPFALDLPPRRKSWLRREPEVALAKPYCTRVPYRTGYMACGSPGSLRYSGSKFWTLPAVFECAEPVRMTEYE